MWAYKFVHGASDHIFGDNDGAVAGLAMIKSLEHCSVPGNRIDLACFQISLALSHAALNDNSP